MDSVSSPRHVPASSSVSNGDESIAIEKLAFVNFDKNDPNILRLILDARRMDDDEEAYDFVLGFLKECRDDPVNKFHTTLLDVPQNNSGSIPQLFISSKKPYIAAMYLDALTEAFLRNQTVRDVLNSDRDYQDRFLDSFAAGLDHSFGTVRHSTLRALFHVCQHCPSPVERRTVLVTIYNKMALLINESPAVMLQELKSDEGSHQAGMIHPEGAENIERALQFTPRWSCRLNELAALTINVLAQGWSDKTFAKKAQLLQAADRLLPNLLVPLTASRLPVAYPETRLFQAICETLEILVSHPLERVGHVVVLKNKEEVINRRKKELEMLDNAMKTAAEKNDENAVKFLSAHLERVKEPLDFNKMTDCNNIFNSERLALWETLLRMSERIGIRITPDNPQINLPGVKNLMDSNGRNRGFSKLVWCLYRTYTMCSNYVKDVESHRSAFSQTILERFAVLTPINDDVWWKAYTSTLHATLRSIVSFCEKLADPMVYDLLEHQVDHKNWIKYIEIMLGELENIALPHLDATEDPKWPSEEELLKPTIPAAAAFLAEGTSRGIRIDGKPGIFATSFSGTAVDAALLAMNKLGVSGIQWNEGEWGQPEALTLWMQFWQRAGLSDVFAVRERKDDPRTALDCHPWFYVKRSTTAKTCATRFFSNKDYQTALGFFLRGADLAEAGRNPSIAVSLSSEEREKQSQLEEKTKDIAIKEKRLEAEFATLRNDENKLASAYFDPLIRSNIDAWKKVRRQQKRDAGETVESDAEIDSDEECEDKPDFSPSEEEAKKFVESGPMKKLLEQRKDLVERAKVVAEERSSIQESLRDLSISIADRCRKMRYGDLEEPQYTTGPLRNTMTLEARTLLVTNLSNAAECALRLEEPILASSLVLQALKVDSRHTKSISRLQRSYAECRNDDEKKTIACFTQQTLGDVVAKELVTPVVEKKVSKPLGVFSKFLIFAFGGLILAATGNAAYKTILTKMEEKRIAEQDAAFAAANPNAAFNKDAEEEIHPSIVNLEEDITQDVQSEETAPKREKKRSKRSKKSSSKRDEL